MTETHVTMLAAFDAWLTERPLTLHTQRSYRREIERFARWMGSSDLRQLGDEPLRGYLDALTSPDPIQQARAHITKALGSGSLLQAKRILGAFLLWLAARGECPVSMVLVLRSWRPEPAPGRTSTSPPEIIDLYRKHVDTDRTQQVDTCALRDRCIQHLAFWTGAKLQEIAELRGGDLEIRHGKLRVQLRNPSGGLVWRRLPDICLAAWRRYRAKIRQHRAQIDYAFRSQRDSTSGLSPVSIARAIAKIRDPRSSGVHGTLRGIRREFVAMAYQHGWRPMAVAHYLRRTHAPVDTAQIAIVAYKELESLALTISGRDVSGKAGR